MDEYWDARGLGEEAAAWADRIMGAIADLSQDQLVPARALWLHTTIRQATRRKDAGQPDQAAQAYRDALAYLQNQPVSD